MDLNESKPGRNSTLGYISNWYLKLVMHGLDPNIFLIIILVILRYINVLQI